MSSRNELSTVSPAGTSAFDFTEVFCLSPQSSPQCKSSPRPSWGDRDLPQSIANLRDAINARSRTAATDASGPRSPDTPNIVARLMGLDDLPGEEKSASKHINRGGASIKQEMLQDGLQSFPSPSLALAEKRAEQWNAGRTDSTELCIPSFPDRNASMQAEYHSMSKSIKMIQVDNKAKSATTTTTPRQSRAYGMNSLENLKIPRPAQSRKTGNLAAVNLKQSEQGLPSSSESQDGHHDEIEQRLMQLGLQSSEQERETLKQVLEAMELKGLLKSPHVIRSSEVIKPDHTPPCSSITTSEVDRHAIFNVNRSTGILPRDPLMAKPTMCRGPIMSHNKRKTKSAPIAAKRPFKPVGKSLGLPFSAANQRVSNERAKPRSFSGVKLVSSSQKLQTESKSKDVSVKELANANLTRARTSHVAPASSRVAEQAKTENRRTSSKTKDDLRHTVEGCTRANPFEGSEKSKANISSQRFQDKSVKPKGRMKHRLIIVDKNDNSIPAKTLNDNDAGAFTRGVQHRSEKYECTSGRCRSHLSPQKAIPGDALGAETPPRAINRVRGLRKGECDFDKDVEQFSPVSVLEKQLSDNEACDSPVSEEGCHRKGLCSSSSSDLPTLSLRIIQFLCGISLQML
ncbi:hypothetical protein KP509_14G068500 [Ceratopteris richardii]|uniref:DUF3741 domain-containing protein n=1 Tax=Ceratopteris richardii TaxID=49495 RepID=A0A8T2T8X3_CERRI|nr:hypothetical protein KP509_14G068500 [Ceratopteris richardii]